MFRLRLFPLAALAGLLLVFPACERHHPGELPEIQREHMHPLQNAAAEEHAAQPVPPSATATPANFFPSPTP